MREPKGEAKGVYHFADWPEHRFLSWLGGFFDGEGCVYMKPKRVGIEVSIVNTDQDAIHSIHQRLGFGEVSTLREAGERHQKQLIWRVRTLHEVRKFLVLVRPYLTIKATRADRAIARVSESTERQRQSQKRREEIFALRGEGLSHAVIARRLRTTPSNVTQALNRKAPERTLL